MQRPSAIGLFLCERVIVNRDDGRRSFIEVFDERVCPGFPFDLGRFHVYAKLTDGLGRVALELVVSSLETEERIETILVEVQFPNRS